MHDITTYESYLPFPVIFQSVTLLQNGLEVQYDGIKTMKIIAPPGMESLCGICGNNDGTYDENDMALGWHVNGENGNSFNQMCYGQMANGTPGDPVSKTKFACHE